MECKSDTHQLYLYVLELADGKYYVGQSKYPDKRIRQHFAGSGAAWTRKHRPLKEMRRENLGAIDVRSGELAENAAVVGLMREHGYANVRGGFFSNLSDELIVKGLISHGLADLAGADRELNCTVDEKRSSMAVSNTNLLQVDINHLGPPAAEYYVFVLRLERGKYYVGYTSNLVDRLPRYMSGKKRISEWTVLYRPIEVVSTRCLGHVTESEAAHSATDEAVTLMHKVGWKNVRGGSWKSIDPEKTLKSLLLRGHGDVPAESPPDH